MASQHEIGLTYNWMSRFFPKVFGSAADISCAFYDGNYSKTLEQAQHDKHEWVLNGIGFKPCYRVLDVGCGWGNMLHAISEKGGAGVGLTLSTAQAQSCRSSGLDVMTKDWKGLGEGSLGRFDAVVSIGAFEHFCSIDEYKSGEQEQIYTNFFTFCASHVPVGGKLYLQTMTWGEQVPDPASGADLAAARGSDSQIIGRLTVFYPGSWLPSGKPQIIRLAHPFFKLIESNNGRQDYIQTLNEWQRGIWRYAKNPFHWPNVVWTLLSHTLKDPQFIHRPISILRKDQREVFVRKLFDHERMFFERSK